MFKPLLALILASAAPVAANSAAPAGQWTLANGDQGCMVHSSSARGTVLSITATPGEDMLLFVVQSPQFASLEDGRPYPIAVEFDDLGEWQIEALAQTQLDADGPGVIFAVRPGREDGQNFIREFARAQGMSIGSAGAPLDTVSLAGGNGAMTSLAQCLGQKWAGGPSYEGQGGPIEEEESAAESDALEI